MLDEWGTLPDSKLSDHSIQLEECHCQHVGRYWENVQYFSSTWRLYYNHDAGGRVCIGNVWHEIHPKNLYLIAPGTNFLTDQTGNPKQLYVHFLAGRPFHQCNRDIFAFKLDEFSALQIQTICDLIESNQSPFSPPLSMKILSLCGYQLSKIPADDLMQIYHDSRIEKLVFQLKAYPHDPLSVEDMATMCHLSRGGFLRLFKRCTGSTPHQFLLTLRLEKAKYLLEHTDTTIEQISMQCGFADRFHFSRCFKKWHGDPPSRYREASQSK